MALTLADARFTVRRLFSFDSRAWRVYDKDITRRQLS
jgi:hypothetical protein